MPRGFSARAAAVAGISAAAMLAASMPSSQAMASSDARAEDRSQNPRLQHAMEALVERPTGPPGIVVVVHRGNDRRVLTAGVADVDTGRKIQVNDHLRIASVSKAFSGAVALALVDRGRLSLRDTIGQRLPYLPNAWADVTLGQLLQHTSGLPDFTKNKAFQNEVIAHPTVSMPPRKLLSFIKHKDLKFDPGSRFKYSNSDNVAVGLMVQAVTRESYGGAMRRLVSKPLHLGRTSLPKGIEMPRPFIHGYEMAPGQPPDDISEIVAAGLAYASGGVVSTPADLDRFIRGYVGARLFDRSLQNKQLRLVAGHSEPPGPGLNKAGMAIFRYQTRCGTVYGHTGNTFGYTAFAAATRDGRRSVTVTITRQLTPKDDLAMFTAYRKLQVLAVCAALRN
ncbi:MAG TPA: serine hydrolase domain-containing protein [Nocardioidaceae bacterium]|nr:serine hydrolase domain-containing protein [Nocardioidaceae bacterium]